MCGIVGFAGFDIGNHQKILELMTGQILHRGPDDSGYILSNGTALGMRRLSIIDIDTGKQPIVSNDGTLAIVFNGEIYNFLEIRNKLEKIGKRFNTQSDTEVILNAYQEWGTDVLEHLRGMFAFAIVDLRNGDLFIARDRMGVKPLYFAKIGAGIVFGSELKTIVEHPAVSRDIDFSSIDTFLDFRSVHGPGTMFKQVKKFPPGHYAQWKSGEFNLKRYWSISNISTFEGTSGDAQEEFNRLFDESVKVRMISERPVGAYLSGGIDSTSIISSIKKQMGENLNTFSVGGWKGDELEAARRIASSYGTTHHEIDFTVKDFENLPKLTWCLDEPIGDPIVMPMFMLSKKASETVTVVHSGEGADELLGGFMMHKLLMLSSLYERYMPKWSHSKVVLPFMKNAPLDLLERFFDYPGNLGEKGRDRAINFLKDSYTKSSKEQYRQIVRLFETTQRDEFYIDKIQKNIQEFRYHLDQKDSSEDFNQKMILLYEDWLPYLSMQMLDRITMGNSIEGRVPFTDHKLVEFSFSLPAKFKTGLLRNKKLLRNYIQTEAVTGHATKKKAFYMPIDQYMQEEPLRSMLEELLSEESIKRRGIFKPEKVSRLVNATRANSTLDGKQVFSIAMLELWFRIFVDKEKGWVS